MKKLISQHKLGIMGKYLFTYTLALLLIGILIASAILVITVKKIRNMELASWEHSISRAAEELEIQQDMLDSIHSRMMISYNFQPAALSSGVVGEMKLLEEITAYTTQSPLSNQFFALYAGDSHIYLSEGYKSLYKSYMRVNIGCSETEAMTIYDQIQASTSFSVISVGKEKLLFVYPTRFPSARTMAYTCFFVPKKSLKASLEMIAGNPLSQYTIFLENKSILSEEMPPLQIAPKLAIGTSTWNEKMDNYRISARSEAGKFIVITDVPLQAMFSFSGTDHISVVLIVGLILVAILLLAVLFAYINSKPIRNLANRVSQSPICGDELKMMEEAFITLERENSVSLNNLRDQIIFSMLDGNYSPDLLGRWDVFKITFDFSYLVVFLVRAEGYPVRDSGFIRQIEAISDADIHLYAVWRSGIVEIIANFQESSQSDTIEECIKSLANPYSTLQVYIGGMVESPYKLNISRLEALALMQQKRSVKETPSTLFAGDRQQMITEICTLVLEYSEEEQLDVALEKFREYIRWYAPSLLIQKHVCYDLLNHLMHCAQENKINMDSRDVSKLLMIQNFDVFLQDFRNLILELFPPERMGKHTELSEQLIAYIKENACDCNLSVDRLVTLFHISSIYLNNLIKKETSLCFKEYVTYLRIKNASELLLSKPDMTVNEISCICGYNKPSNFIKKFKEITTQTPVQYRKQGEHGSAI